MENKTMFSSKVEAAYESQKTLSNDGISKNALYCTPLFFIMAIFSTYMSISNGDGFWIIMAVGSWIFFVITLFITAIIISTIRNEKSSEQQVKKQLAIKIDGDFYNKCIAEGYSDLTKRSNVEKIYNLAKSEGYKESKEQIIEIYKRTDELLDENEADKKVADEKAKLQEAINHEIEIEETNKKYINFKGIQKPSAMIDEKITDLKQVVSRMEAKARSINNGAQAYYHTNKQHEANWATHGGIASALGGTAAGVSVAVDVAQRAAEAKSHNQQLKQTATTMASVLNAGYYNSISDVNSEIEDLKKKKKDLQLLLVEELDEDKLLKYISPKISSQEIRESGAIIMNIVTKKSPNFLIFDDVPAVVDGSVKVMLMNGNNVVGTAFFSLPFSGSEEQSTITVVCREVEGTVTEVQFKPHHLWAIEKTKK